MHCKNYIPEYYTMREINEETNSWPMYYEDKILNRHLYNGCFLSSSAGYSDFDKQGLKRTMLEHEAIFRKQVYELHRLYGIQRDLMEGFQKNDLTRVSGCTTNSKKCFSSLEPQSQIVRSAWQKSNEPDMSSTKSGETTTHTNANISTISFCESNLQSCFGSWESRASGRDGKSNAGFRTPTKRMLDLRFLTDVYVDTEFGEQSQKEHIACSSSVTAAPYSRKYNDDHEDVVKLTLSNASFGNEREDNQKNYAENKSSFFNYFGDINEIVKDPPLEETTFSFSGYSGPGTQLDENRRIDGLLRFNNFLRQTSYSKNQGCDERAFSNLLSTLKQEQSQISSQSHSEADPLECKTSSHFGKEKCPVSFEPIQHSQIKETEVLLTDHNDVQIPEMSFHKIGFNHGFNLSYSNMNINLIKSSPFDVRMSESVPNNKAWSQMDEDGKEASLELSLLKSKPSSNESLNLNGLYPISGDAGMQRNDISVLGKIESIQVVEMRQDSLLSDRGCLKQIDLNSEAPSIEEPSFYEMPETSDSFFPSLMARQEDNVKEAAENLLKLSVDTVKHGDDKNSLFWFADFALLHAESADSELDLFEQMTLQLEEMKPDDKACHNPREAEKTNFDEKSRTIILKKPRRGQAKKRRQKLDFQRDTLPGLVTLSRHEMIEDLQTIGGLMRASGFQWEAGSGRQQGGQNCTRVRTRKRPPMRKSTVKKPPKRNSKTLFEFDGPGMIGWGKTTRRCQRPRCSPLQPVTTALI